MQAEARDPNVPMRTLVSAHMTTWAAGSAYPVAEIRSSIGQAGLHSTGSQLYCRRGFRLITSVTYSVNEHDVCCAANWVRF